MLPLKCVRSFVFGDASSVFGDASSVLNHPTLFTHHLIPSDNDDNDAARSLVDTKRRCKKTHESTDKKPVLVFLPTRQLVTDTYALANLARSLGIDIHPDPSLSRIVFAAPLSSALPPSSSNRPSTSMLSQPSSNFPPPSTSPSSFSFSPSSALGNGFALPFPSLPTVLSSMKAWAKKGLQNP